MSLEEFYNDLISKDPVNNVSSLLDTSSGGDLDLHVIEGVGSTSNQNSKVVSDNVNSNHSGDCMSVISSSSSSVSSLSGSPRMSSSSSPTSIDLSSLKSHPTFSDPPSPLLSLLSSSSSSSDLTLSDSESFASSSHVSVLESKMGDMGYDHDTNIFGYIFGNSADVFINRDKILGNNEGIATKDKISVNDYILSGAYLHSEREIREADIFGKKDFLKLLLGHYKTIKEETGSERNEFAVNGNNEIFMKDVIDLGGFEGFTSTKNSSGVYYGSPSAFAHDNSGLLFLGTIKGYIIVTLDVICGKYLQLFDPNEDSMSKIVSISVNKSDVRDHIYLSAARVDGSIFIWRVNCLLIKESLMREDSTQDVTLEIGFHLINKSIKLFENGILNHDFIDIRNQSLSKLALFISDLRGNLFVLLLEQSEEGEQNRNYGTWIVTENVFLYHSDEGLIHEFRPFPIPPVVKSGSNKPVSGGNTYGANKRELILMDYHQLYLVGGKRKFSIISMLPHPALCKVVDVFEDLRLRDIPIASQQDVQTNCLHLNWLRPSVIFKNKNLTENCNPADTHAQVGTDDSATHKIEILVSIDRYLCLYQVTSFEECKEFDELSIEVDLKTVWEFFDVINGVQIVSNTLVSLLIGLSGVYIYQIMESDGKLSMYETSTRINEEFSNFSIVKCYSGRKNADFHCSDVGKREDICRRSKQTEFYPLISSLYQERENVVLACVYKYGQGNKRFLIVSQSVMNSSNEFGENIQLFCNSLISCTSTNDSTGSKTNKIMLLLNDKVIIFTLLFKSWMTFLENEYNRTVELTNTGDADLCFLSWLKHSSTFISLFERRLPPLLTWNTFNREMIPIVLKNIFNSLLNKAMLRDASKADLEDGPFQKNCRVTKIVDLVLDSSSRMGMWEYLFSEAVLLIKTHGEDIVVSFGDSEDQNATLFDYYIKSLILRLVSGEIKPKSLNNEIVRTIVDWYDNIVSRCDCENKQILLSEVEYLMIRTLTHFQDCKSTNKDENLAESGKNGSSPWLRLVPVFKNNHLWSSYITLYLYNGKDPIPLFKRLVTVLLNDYFLQEFERSNSSSEKFNLIEYQQRVESDPSVLKFYHFICSFLFKIGYPFNEYTENYAKNSIGFQKDDCFSLELEYNSNYFIKLVTTSVFQERRDALLEFNISCYLDVLILTSIRIYVCMIIELNKRKVTLLSDDRSIEEENVDQLIVWYEKLSFIMQDRLESFIYFHIRKISNTVDGDSDLCNLSEETRDTVDYKSRIFDLFLRKQGSETDLCACYMVGHYVIYVLNSLDKYNLNSEQNFVPIIRCIFTLLQRLIEGFDDLKVIQENMVGRIEYYLIMAIIRNNRSNHGINFLVLISNAIHCLDAFSNVSGDISDDRKMNDLEVNKSISQILKKYSLYNLSLYLSIQVFDLENVLDIFSKERYINSNILKELYIMDDNNNILLSFNYIMSTIEKGIKFNVFDYDHVLLLIIRYADLLSKIDSLNTIELVINILERCLTVSGKEESLPGVIKNDTKRDNSGIYDYSNILKNGLNTNLYRLLLDSLLFKEDVSMYKRGENSSRWNSFINGLLPTYLSIMICDLKASIGNSSASSKSPKTVTEGKVLALLDHWYKSSREFDELINVPLSDLFSQLEKNDLPLGMIYINHVLVTNPALYSSREGQVSESRQVVESCVRRFEEYLNSMAGILNSSKFAKDSFVVNVKKTNNSNKTVIFMLNGSEFKEKPLICGTWDQVLELSSLLYLYCFSSGNDSEFLNLYTAVIKSLFSNMDKYCVWYLRYRDGGKIEQCESAITNIIVSRLLKNTVFNKVSHSFGASRSQNSFDSSEDSYCGTLNVNGPEMMIVLYYVLAFHLLGNENYRYLLQKYIHRHMNLSVTLFNGRLNKVFSDQISNYYNFIKPILLVIIKDADHMPCRFWRHLALNMINTRLFTSKCNDQLTQLFQSDLLHLFGQLVDSSRKAIRVELIGGEWVDDVDSTKVGLDSSICYICRQHLYNFSEFGAVLPGMEIGEHNVDDFGRENRKETSSFVLNIVSEGTNGSYHFNEEYYGKENYIQDNGMGDQEEECIERESELEELLVFRCGSVFHKKCYYEFNTKFGAGEADRRKGGIRDGICGDVNENDSIDLNVSEGTHSNLKCLHQYSIFFN